MKHLCDEIWMLVAKCFQINYEIWTFKEYLKYNCGLISTITYQYFNGSKFLKAAKIPKIFVVSMVRVDKSITVPLWIFHFVHHFADKSIFDFFFHFVHQFFNSKKKSTNLLYYSLKLKQSPTMAKILSTPIKIKQSSTNYLHHSFKLQWSSKERLHQYIKLYLCPLDKLYTIVKVKFHIFCPHQYLS